MPHQTARYLAILAFAASVWCSPIMSVSHAQTVEDGSDAVIGKEDTRTVLGLVGSYLEKSTEPKVSALRRAKGSVICGTVNVKGKEGLYLGERGFIADLAIPSFARVPEGVELLNPRAEGFEEKERVRQQYFAMCLD